MKGEFDAYVLWPLAKKFHNWIVDGSVACDFTVCISANKEWELEKETKVNSESLLIKSSEIIFIFLLIYAIKIPLISISMAFSGSQKPYY